MIVRIRRPHTGARFIHPLDPEPRTAILAGGFQETKAVRVFPRGWSDSAERFRPACIAGPPERLRNLAGKVVSVENSLIVFTYEGKSGLSHSDREMFWKAFGVPVFEQYLGPRNELLAMECDAHSGLHVVTGCEDLRLERDVCACGNSAPRLSRAARLEELAELLA
jgi:hypothetical protein